MNAEVRLTRALLFTKVLYSMMIKLGQFRSSPNNRPRLMHKMCHTPHFEAGFFILFSEWPTACFSTGP